MGVHRGRAGWWLVAAAGAMLGAGACTSMLDLDGYDYQPANGGGGADAGGGTTSGTGGSSGSGGAAPASCTDGSKNGDETDTDCGGNCPACANGKDCNAPADCQSGVCSGGTCSACTSGAACDEGAYCDGGTCKTKKANGEPCAGPAQCQSGHCPGQDGVCCDIGCTGTCRSCLKNKTGNSDGDCSNITLGTDPDGDCTSDIACNGNGDCIGCGFVLNPPGGSCPPACTGGCTQDTCIIDCTVDGACAGGNLICPSDFDCTVNCHGLSACASVTIICPTLYQCTIDCDLIGSCNGTKVQCGNGPCDLHCNASGDCDGASVSCGINACSATCTSAAIKPTMSCGSACSCDGCN